jgi:uncharacterized hydrophobic protein (TIGR00271 family)
MSAGGASITRVEAWVRLALIPVAVLLLVLGVWLLPALTSLGRVAAALLGVVWVSAVVVALRRLSVPIPVDDLRRVEAELFVDPSDRDTWNRQFVTLLTLSSVIAVLGLLADSTAVVIGAMVVAPLMAPLMSLAGALTLTRPALILQNAIVVALGSALAVATGAVVSWIVPGTAPTAELLARTQPQLTDLGIALAAGAAGAYVTVRPQALGALPGVAIAVALVPPLATVGVMLETGDRGAAGQASILFLTNLAAIVLSASIVFLIAGLTASASEIRRRRRLQVGLALAVAATLAVMIPLARNSVVRHEELTVEADIRSALEAVARSGGNVVEQVTIRSQDEAVVAAVEIVGASPPDAAALAAAAARELGEPVELDIVWRYGEVAIGRP